MKWLEYLENCNISFKIHILQKYDCILIPGTKSDYQVLYILDGLMEILQIFTNNEKICVQLLHKNSIFKNFKYDHINTTNYYYKAVAITKTALVTVPCRYLINKINKKPNILSNFLLNQQKDNHDIIHILSHKNTKKRIIQLLLTLAKSFGHYSNGNVIIPFCVPHYVIGNITGSQRANISKIMNYLKKNRIIYYDKQKIILYNIIKLIEA